MDSFNIKKPEEKRDKHKVLFFAGGETRDDRFNVFTGSFIKLMTQILGDNFEFIKGIYYRAPARNIIWALNNSQKPIRDPESSLIINPAFRQIISAGLSPDTQVIITSSSSGSIVAAQTACYLAKKNRNNVYFHKPFHLILGASMISEKSALFRQLLQYQKEGTIGSIIHDEIQDEGDTSAGVGDVSVLKAYMNAFRLILPFFSKRFTGPSFLNTHPVKGHIHRKRSQTVKKALDYIDIILIKHNLAGDYYKEKALSVIKESNT